MDMKYCPPCQQELSINKFALDGKKFDKNGNQCRRNICKKCRNKKRRENRRERKFNNNLIQHNDINTDFETKLCVACGKEKDINQFSKNGHVKKNGTPKRRRYCNECRNKIRKGLISKENLEILKKQERIKKEITDQAKRLENIEVGEFNFNKEEERKKLISALVELARADIQRLDEITENEFVSKTNSEHIFEEYDYCFDELKNDALSVVLDMGFHRSSGDKFGKGRYLVVGDSHGKHTKRKMFKLLKSLNNHLEFDQIIHVGHILDDDNVISYCWKDFDNLTVLSKMEESPHIENHIEQDYNFNVVRDYLYLGKLKVMNQDLIADYVKTAISTIDQRIYNESMIVNLHRHEMDTKCTYKNNLILSSPGCLCEKHIVKTIKQIDFTSGYQVREAKSDSFIKYRRMRHLYEFWEQGMLVVEVDDSGDFTITPCRIKKLDDEYVTSYFDKIYIGDKVVKPHNKIFINTDIHCDKHDAKVLDIQNQFVSDYKPNVYVNLGDMQNNKSMNHHEMERGIPMTRSFLKENATTAYLLNKMADWSNDNYFIYGNHERFLMDFYKKYPQLTELMEKTLMSPIEEAGYKFIGHKGILELDNLKLFHGDIKMFGQGGKSIEKTARTFGEDSIIGHLHHNAIRFGAYIIGMTGKYDQDYNEVNASKWIHGFGICNQYCGLNFISCISISNHKALLNNKKYSSENENFWVTPEYDVEIKYKFK